MPDPIAAVRKLLADLGIPADQKLEDLDDALKKRLLDEAQRRLRDLIGASDYDEVIAKLQAVSEDPQGELVKFVKGVLEDWLSERGLTPSDKLADALMKAFADPGSVFAKDEWMSMPRDDAAGKLKYYGYLQAFRAFVFEWGHDLLARGGEMGDPQAKPNVFSAAGTVQLSTPLIRLACSCEPPNDSHVADWLEALKLWGPARYPGQVDPIWLVHWGAEEVKDPGRTVRHVIEAIDYQLSRRSGDG